MTNSRKIERQVIRNDKSRAIQIIKIKHLTTKINNIQITSSTKVELEAKRKVNSTKYYFLKFNNNIG